MALAARTWDTHDFSVKMLDWSAAHGSRLAYTCRRCGRRFCQFTLYDQRIWAVDDSHRAVENKLNESWLSEPCPRLFQGVG